MMVLTEKDVEVLLEFINCNEMLAYDTETSGLSVRKDTIVGFGVSNATSGFYVPCYRWSPDLHQLIPYGVSRQLATIVLEALARKQLLMFNASFDARITEANFGIKLLPALHTDVLLLKHTCDEDFPLDLKGIAANLWGTDVKEEKKAMQASIKANGGTAKQYYKADVEVLARYCEQDCLLTYKLYNYYRPKLDAAGLTAFYYQDEVLPLYKLVTIPMESKGVALDMAKLRQAQGDITACIGSLEEDIQKDIEPHLSTFRSWFLNKDFPLLTYTGKEPAWRKKHASQYEAWQATATGPMFNLQSKHHLKKLLFDTLQEVPLSKTPTGLPQVDEDFLESIKLKHAWVAKLIEYNKLNKIKSTYIDRLLEEQEEGIFYATYAQHRTVSGRYAGDMQQLPRPLEASQASEAVVHFTNLVREFIVPRPACLLISADYEQLEPSIFAHTSNDPALQEIFNAGTDFYSTVAINTESALAAYSGDKTAPNYLGKTNKAARQKAKSYALGIPYGMSGYKLKFELDCLPEEAEALIENYLSAFPKLKEAMNARRDEARFSGMVRAPMGRVRHMPQAKAIYERYGPCIDHDLELWKRYHEVPSVYARAKADRRVYKNLLNNALNFPVQSTAASVINRAAIMLAKEYKLIPVAQVHDELVYETQQNEAELISGTIKQVMQTIVKLSVPLRTEPKIGTNYRECK